jgi:hypothetical protein
MSVVNDPVAVYRFGAGHVESVDGSHAARLSGITCHALDTPLSLPGGPPLEHVAVLAGQSTLRLPVSAALVDAACFGVDMLIRAVHGGDARMQLLTIHAPTPALSLTLEARDSTRWHLHGAIRVQHANVAGAHWCGVRATEAIPLFSDASSGTASGLAPGIASGLTPGIASGLAPGIASGLASGIASGLAPGIAPGLAAHGAFPALPGWACVALVFTGDDLVLLQDGVVIARRIFHEAALASVPASQAGCSIGADPDGRYGLHGAVAAVRLWNGIPALYSAALAAAERRGIGALASRRAELEEGSPPTHAVLGAEIRAEHGMRMAGIPGRICEHEHGALLWSRDTGAHAVHGVIHRAYQASGWRSKLGWPLADERESAGTRVQRFQRGAILWSATTGAHPVHGPIFARYLALGGEHGVLGLPIQPPQRTRHGAMQEFQHGRLVHTRAAGTHALFGPTLARYLALPGRTELLGHPVADTLFLHDRTGALVGHVSHFERGSIYWSPQNGAWEICGRLALHYQCCGGPLGALGFPVAAAPSDSNGAMPHARLERGLIARDARHGTCALHGVRLRLERVRRLRNTRTPAFAVRVWLRVDQEWIHDGTRVPAEGYASATANLALTHVFPVQPETELWMRIEICDHDDSDRVIGAIEELFDFRDLWGIWSGNGGRHEVPIAVHRDAHAFAFAFRVTPASAIVPSRLPANPPGQESAGTMAFRRLGWWRFGNFRARALAREQLAGSFRPPLPASSGGWPALPAPGLPSLPSLPSLIDASFHDLAYAGVAASGSCFGLVTAAIHALKSGSPLNQPIHRYHLTPEVRAEIERRHGQQLGAELIRWFASLVASPQALSARAVFDHVERALRAHTPVPLCIYDVPGDRGDCVLAYACTRAGEDHGRIFIADPNASRSLGHDDAVVRVLADDTFQLEHQPERFRNQRAGDDLLPDVLLLPVPFHVFANTPGAPAAELGLALDELLGGLVVLAGDAEIEQIASQRAELYRKLGGRRHLVARGLPGMIRVPRLEASPSSQLYAQRGPLPDRLDLYVKGTKARGGRFALCVGTQHAEVRVDAAIDRGAVDTVALHALRAAPHLHLSTTMPHKLARVACRIHRDPHGRVSRGIALAVPLLPDDRTSIRMDAPGGAVGIRPAGPPQPIDVTLEAVASDGPQQVVLRGLTIASAGEALRIRPRDWSALGGEIVVERLDGLDGAVRARLVTRGQAP